MKWYDSEWNPIKAMEAIFKNHIDKVVEDIGIEKFWKEKYYNEYMDNLIKAHRPLFEELY